MACDSVSTGGNAAMAADVGECDEECAADALGEAAADARPGGVTLRLGVGVPLLWARPSRRSCSFLLNSLVMCVKNESTLRLAGPAAACRAGGATDGVGEEGGRDGEEVAEWEGVMLVGTGSCGMGLGEGDGDGAGEGDGEGDDML